MHEMSVEQEWSSKQTKYIYILSACCSILAQHSFHAFGLYIYKICNGSEKLSQMRSMQRVTSKKGRKPRASNSIHAGKARTK